MSSYSDFVNGLEALYFSPLANLSDFQVHLGVAHLSLPNKPWYCLVDNLGYSYFAFLFYCIIYL